MKKFYSYRELVNDLHAITREMHLLSYKPDVIIGPGRGGYIPGVMLSHYFDVPFRGFNWQTRDGEIQDANTLNNIVSSYVDKNILCIDDINDTGETLCSIDDTVYQYAIDNMLSGIDISYAVLFNKATSKFKEVNFYANELTLDHNKWIVFPFENWWDTHQDKEQL